MNYIFPFSSCFIDDVLFSPSLPREEKGPGDEEAGGYCMSGMHQLRVIEGFLATRTHATKHAKSFALIGRQGPKDASDYD